MATAIACQREVDDLAAAPRPRQGGKGQCRGKGYVGLTVAKQRGELAGASLTGSKRTN